MLSDILRPHCKRLTTGSRALTASSQKDFIIHHRFGQRSLSSERQKQVIFSGIQPTGVPHLGNYLGALQQWVRLQDEVSPSTRLLFSVVDLHAITVTQNADLLRRWKRETLATLLAVGLKPERCTIFYQSTVRCSAYGSLRCSRGQTDGDRSPNMQSLCGY